MTKRIAKKIWSRVYEDGMGNRYGQDDGRWTEAQISAAYDVLVLECKWWPKFLRAWHHA